MTIHTHPLDGDRTWDDERRALVERIGALEAALAAHTDLQSTNDRSSDRFRQAFEHAAVGMALVAPDGHWLDVNQALSDLIGYTPDELRATTFQALTHPEDLEGNLRAAQQMLAGTIHTYQVEKRYYHKQGHTLWALMSLSLARDPAGQPLYFIAQIQDISAQKQAEADLRDTINRTNALYTVTALATDALEIGALLNTVVRTAASVLPADRAVLITIDQATQTVIHQVEGGPGAMHVPRLSYAELWAGLSGEVLRTGESVISLSESPDPRESLQVQQRRAHDLAGSIVVVPLQSQSRMLGTLTAINAPGGAEFTIRDRDLLAALGSQAAIALDRMALVAELEQRATIDMLTHTLNRRAWLEHAQRLIAITQRSLQPTSVIFLDVDYFKLVNDTYGHEVGDRALAQISRACQQNVRLGDLVGRYGGEEFAILLPNADHERVMAVAERLRSAIEAHPLHVDSRTLHLTVSQGVATMAGPDCDLAALITQADRALYLAKRDGRNLVRHAGGPVV
jgi:diguanylate cyclase